MRKTIPVIVVMVLAACALGGQETSRSTARTSSQTALLHPESLRDLAPEVFRVRFITTKGEFVTEVTRAWAPRGAGRFYNLVKYHFYDRSAFFRVLAGFVAQFGISPEPEISRAWEKATLTDDARRQSNVRGTLSFATAGPNTRTTQVFINVQDNTSLDEMGFAPFARIVSGMDVVGKLYSDYGDAPPDGHGPDQNLIQRLGKAYLEKDFPLLDTIRSTEILPSAPPPGR